MKLKILLGGALVAIIAIAGWQQNAISLTRTANEALRQPTAVPAIGGSDAVPIATEEIEALQSANIDLPKLRNEVRKLREERRELERLQAENERLAVALKMAPQTGAMYMLEAEGFVPKEKWVRAGFAMPEMTIHTFFWAVANKDVATLAECTTGKARKSMEQALQQSLDQGGKAFEEQFAPLANMQGFRVAERKRLAEDKIELGIQAAPGGRVMPMRLQLENGEWKLAD